MSIEFPKVKGIPTEWMLAGAVGAVGLLLWWMWRRGTFDGTPPEIGGDDVTTNVSDDWKGKVSWGVFPVVHRERADGVDQRLQDFLDAWEQSGPFEICVCPKGGVRTDAQLQADLYASGKTNAASLADTPHGRGGAVDVAPYYDFAPHWEDWGPFEVIGSFAEAMGLRWGGTFTSLKDGPHVEISSWQSLPYPPTGNVA